MNTPLHFSSASGEWATPQWLFDALDAEFGFTLDPCATRENAKCKKYYTRAQDGISQDWSGEVVFMNPPYGRAIGLWVRKAFESANSGATVVCLLPARTDTHWWHRYVMRAEIRFFRGRLKFGAGRNSAPFPSAVVIFRPPLKLLPYSLTSVEKRTQKSPVESLGELRADHIRQPGVAFPKVLPVPPFGNHMSAGRAGGQFSATPMAMSSLGTGWLATSGIQSIARAGQERIGYRAGASAADSVAPNHC